MVNEIQVVFVTKYKHRYVYKEVFIEMWLDSKGVVEDLIIHRNGCKIPDNQISNNINLSDPVSVLYDCAREIDKVPDNVDQ